MPRKRLELLHRKATASKTVVSTNSTTWADILYGGPGGIRTPEGEAKGFTVLPIWPLWYRPKYKNGATYQTWTDDRRFTKPMLYQLS